MRALALLLVLGLYPLGSYAGYFMPESLYLLLFCLLAWLAAEGGERLSPPRVLAAAALIAALSLVKQHGLFVLAAFAAALLLWNGLAPGRRLRGAASAALLVAAYFACFRAGGRLLSPAALVHPVGDYYQELIARSLRAPSLVAIATVLTGYVAAVFMLAGPSLVFVGGRVLAQLRGRAPRTGAGFTGLFLLLVVALIVPAVALILARDPDRIHLRFLNFGLVALVALSWRLDPRTEPPGFRAMAAAVWAAATLVFLWRWPGFRALPVDAPELFFAYHGEGLGRFGLGRAAWAFTVLVFLGGAGALLWRRLRWFDVQLAVLGLTAAVSIWNLAHWQAGWSAQFAPLRAVGKAARALCGPGERDVVAIAPNDRFVDLYQGLAALDRPAPMLLTPPADTARAFQALPPGACLMAPVDPGAGFERLYGGPELALFRRR